MCGIVYNLPLVMKNNRGGAVFPLTLTISESTNKLGTFDFQLHLLEPICCFPALSPQVPQILMDWHEN